MIPSTLTGIKDTDRLILSMLESDKDLLRFCSTSKYAFKLCDDRLFRNRLYQKYPEAAKYKPDKEKWRKYYFQVAYWVNKMLEDYGFQYVTGDPEVYYNFFNKHGNKSLNMQLIRASENGHLLVVKYLVDKGADIHADNDNALRWASRYGHLPVVKYLVDKGANIHAWNDDALRLASLYGHLPVVEYLVDNGADIHAWDDYALRWASKNDHLPVVEYLVDKGANIHASDDQALIEASMNGHLPVVEYLVTQGANIHAQDDLALRLASRKGHFPVVKYLKKMGKKR